VVDVGANGSADFSVARITFTDIHVKAGVDTLDGGSGSNIVLQDQAVRYPRREPSRRGPGAN
jgi:hypothetical protein